jgi:hypothetical protein
MREVGGCERSVDERRLRFGGAEVKREWVAGKVLDFAGQQNKAQVCSDRPTIFKPGFLVPCIGLKSASSLHWTTD